METRKKILELKNELYQAERLLEEEEKQAQLDSVTQRCRELAGQVYWKSVGSHITSYSSIVTVRLLKINKLIPSRCYPSQLEGEWESLLLPILPTLIMNKSTDDKARGIYLQKDGPVLHLKARKVTAKQARLEMPSYAVDDGTLVFPLSIGGCVDRHSHEELRFFEGLVPSDEAEFRKGLDIIIRFCADTQAQFCADIKFDKQGNIL
jgi:hypothetical protein